MKFNPYGSIPDFGILLWLTPDDFTRQRGDLLDRRELKFIFGIVQKVLVNSVKWRHYSSKRLTEIP